MFGTFGDHDKVEFQRAKRFTLGIDIESTVPCPDTHLPKVAIACDGGDRLISSL